MDAEDYFRTAFDIVEEELDCSRNSLYEELYGSGVNTVERAQIDLGTRQIRFLVKVWAERYREFLEDESLGLHERFKAAANYAEENGNSASAERLRHTVREYDRRIVQNQIESNWNEYEFDGVSEHTVYHSIAPNPVIDTGVLLGDELKDESIRQILDWATNEPEVHPQRFTAQYAEDREKLHLNATAQLHPGDEQDGIEQDLFNAQIPATYYECPL